MDQCGGTGGTTGGAFRQTFGNGWRMSGHAHANIGSVIPGLTLPTRTGHNLVGIYTGSCAAPGTRVIGPTGIALAAPITANNATIFARWEAIQWNPNLDRCGGTGGSTAYRITFGQGWRVSGAAFTHAGIGQPVTGATMPTRANSTLLGIYMGSSCTNLTTRLIDGNGIVQTVTQPTNSNNIFARWQCHAGFQEVGNACVPMACPAGYWRPSAGADCTCVGVDFFSPATSAGRYPCLSGHRSSGCGAGAAASANCVPFMTLRTGNGTSTIMRRGVHGDSPRHLAVQVGANVYFGNLSVTPATGAVRINIGGVTYYLTNNEAPGNLGG